MPSRRALLEGGGAVLVVAAGGQAWRASDNGVFSAGDGPASEPWRMWEADTTGGPLRPVRAGILAASPHNTQPWLFRLLDGEIELYADLGRNLGALDPYVRRDAHRPGLRRGERGWSATATGGSDIAGVTSSACGTA